MAKDWIYAKMSQQAATGGGPDAWLDSIKKAAYSNGASDMKNNLVAPLLLAGVGIGAVGVVGYQKIKKWISDKKEARLLTEQEAEEAEIYLKKELDTAIEELDEKDNQKFD